MRPHPTNAQVAHELLPCNRVSVRFYNLPIFVISAAAGATGSSWRSLRDTGSPDTGINGLAEQTCSPHPVRCEWHLGELDRILFCDADALSVNRWHDQTAPCRDARSLQAASRVGAVCWGAQRKF